MFGKEFILLDVVWLIINWVWVMFFSGCVVFNFYVVYYLLFDVWVNFKVFGLLVVILVFILFMGGYIYKYFFYEFK